MTTITYCFILPNNDFTGFVYELSPKQYKHAPSCVVRCPHSSNNFSETAGSIKAKFYVDFKVCSNDDLGLTLTFFTASSTLLRNAFIWGSAKILDFIETIEVYELKVGPNSWISKQMNACGTRGQGHCLAFVQGHSYLYFQASAPKLLKTSKSNFLWSLYEQGTEFIWMM